MSSAPLKAPPNSVEAEQAVLGALILDNRAWHRVEGLLKPDDFYRHDHRLIFTAIATLAGRGDPCDMVTLAEHLRDVGSERDAGGMAYLGQLAADTPSAANIEAYARIVVDRARRRDLLVLHTELREAAQNTDGRSVAELMVDAESRLLRMGDEYARTGSGPAPLQGALMRAVETIEERYENPKQVVGLATGYTDLDELTTGLHPGNLVVLGARPSVGKTALAMNIAEHAAVKGGSVLFVSLEMSEAELALRLVASLGQINLQRLRTGRMTEADWPRLSSAVSVLNTAKLFIDERSALSVAEIRATARRIKNTEGLDLIVIDYLGLMSGEGETQTIKIGSLATGCKHIAKELKVPVLLLAQLNRGVEQRENKRPTLADLRDSGEIEQAADMVWFLYREEMYSKAADAKGVAEVIVAKQRSGPVDTVRLIFRGEYSRFENYAPDIYGDR